MKDSGSSHPKLVRVEALLANEAGWIPSTEVEGSRRYFVERPFSPVSTTPLLRKLSESKAYNIVISISIVLYLLFNITLNFEFFQHPAVVAAYLCISILGLATLLTRLDRPLLHALTQSFDIFYLMACIIIWISLASAGSSRHNTNNQLIIHFCAAGTLMIISFTFDACPELPVGVKLSRAMAFIAFECCLSLADRVLNTFEYYPLPISVGRLKTTTKRLALQALFEAVVFYLKFVYTSLRNYLRGQKRAVMLRLPVRTSLEHHPPHPLQTVRQTSLPQPLSAVVPAPLTTIHIQPAASPSSASSSSGPHLPTSVPPAPPSSSSSASSSSPTIRFDVELSLLHQLYTPGPTSYTSLSEDESFIRRHANFTPVVTWHPLVRIASSRVYPIVFSLISLALLVVTTLHYTETYLSGSLILIGGAGLVTCELTRYDRRLCRAVAGRFEAVTLWLHMFQYVIVGIYSAIQFGISPIRAVSELLLWLMVNVATTFLDAAVGYSRGLKLAAWGFVFANNVRILVTNTFLADGYSDSSICWLWCAESKALLDRARAGGRP